jgi:hypothetical protein
MSDPNEKSPATLLARALDWWHNARARWQRLGELNRLSGDDIDRLAQDVGLNSSEFLRMAVKPDGTKLLIERRLAALHLDPEDIRKLSPLLLRDLMVTCARCSEKDRCAADMALDPNPEGWESYCPNSGTLRTLT